MPWESVTEETLVFTAKSNATRMRLPVPVLAKETDKVDELEAVAFAVDCTNEMDGVVEVMVNVRAAVPLPPLLAAFSVMFDVPAVVGLPEIKPVAVSTDKPIGSPVAP